MQNLLFVLSLFATGFAHARALHVDNNIIQLSQTKITTPALHVRVGDELWYGGMYNIFSSGTLHVRYNNINYSVLSCQPFADTINYTYDADGQLVDANENIYLEIPQAKQNTGVTFNTGIAASANISTQLSFKVGYSNGCHIFGATTKGEYNGNKMYRIVSSGNRVFLQIWDAKRNGNNVQFQLVGPQNSLVPHTKYNYKFGNAYLIDMQTNTVLINAEPFDVLNWSNNAGEFTFRNCNSTWVYNTKIWDNDVLVRHFVPVPCGLQIGDYVVPSNGMWDIVEQKFYGNMGTGDFVYGIDE